MSPKGQKNASGAKGGGTRKPPSSTPKASSGKLDSSSSTASHSKKPEPNESSNSVEVKLSHSNSQDVEVLDKQREEILSSPITDRSGSSRESSAAEQSSSSRVKQANGRIAHEQCVAGTVGAGNSADGSECSSMLFWASLCVLTAASFGTRLHNIEYPSHICWDETHFGKHGSLYINRSFFFDVHPPLGKMLVGLSGLLTGYDGNCSFEKPGLSYNETSYEGMRMVAGCMGAALPPLTYMMAFDLSGGRLTAAVLAGALILFETGTMTLTRFILLDPPLLFFIAVATASYCRFKTCQSFSIGWWTALTITGVGLAGAIGVKFVGVFVIALIGLCTVKDLWELLGDRALSTVTFARHFVARAYCLILLPLILYVLFFAVHFIVLKKSGNGDGFFSSSFQSTLEGNALFDAKLPQFIAYGSEVTIKNHRINGGYLHSHHHLYPEESGGPKQQQVTTYTHKDYNNDWIVKDIHRQSSSNETELVFVHDGDLIRLEHKATQRNLHSHKHPAPFTKSNKQVSCYGKGGVGDTNDFFRVVVVSGGGEPGTKGLTERIMPVSTVFQLIHEGQKCAVEARNKKLPKSWGWDQNEVSCCSNKKANFGLWNIEEVRDKRVRRINVKVFRPGFLSKLIESHLVMFSGNSNLKPKEEEFHSRPWMWPVNYKGQLFSGRNPRILLLGNPIVIWGTTAIVLMFPIAYFVDRFRDRRGIASIQGFKRWYDGMLWLFGAWLLHYAPFWPMTRILYFHHYFPANLFSCTLSALFLDMMFHRISASLPAHRKEPVRLILLGAVLTVLAYSFHLFSPIAYGFEGELSPNSTSVMHGLRWMKTWDF